MFYVYLVGLSVIRATRGQILACAALVKAEGDEAGHVIPHADDP
jgi:hypothetical protein